MYFPQVSLQVRYLQAGTRQQSVVYILSRISYKYLFLYLQTVKRSLEIEFESLPSLQSFYLFLKRQLQGVMTLGW